MDELRLADSQTSDDVQLYQRALREQTPHKENRLSIASFDTDSAVPSPSLGRHNLSLPTPTTPGHATPTASTAGGLRDSIHSTASNIISRIGRSATVSSTDERPKLSISGPVQSIQAEDETKRASTATVGSVSQTSLLTLEQNADHAAPEVLGQCH